MDENQQTVPPAQYPDGSRVLCADGLTLGEVVATYREYLIVERGYFFPTNFYVPYAAIAEAGGGDIVLALTGADALAQGWNTPPADPVVPEAPAPVPTTAEPVATATATTAAPATPVAPIVAPPIETPVAAEPDTATPAPEPAETTTAAPTVAATEAPEAAPETTTTAPPAVSAEETVAVEEAVEVQSYQPDATVPPPAEPEETGTVNLAPSFVGIPGRRLTDAELWSLLEPRDTPSESEEESEDTKDTSDKPGS